MEDAGKGNDLTGAILKILYATADGFQPAEETEPEVEQQQQQTTTNTTVEPEEEAQEETF